jgi:hypothetical protein
MSEGPRRLYWPKERDNVSTGHGPLNMIKDRGERHKIVKRCRHRLQTRFPHQFTVLFEFGFNSSAICFDLAFLARDPH